MDPLSTARGLDLPPGARLSPAPGATTRAEIEERRSRFIALVRRVDDVEEARALVDDARSEFPDARHHCAAWIVSQPGAQPLQHSSDDGEPSGTAGRPMLQALAGAGLTDVAAVVVRYFGGTLLGTGGLVRAYTEAVSAALTRTPLVVRVPLSTVELRLAHAEAGRVEAELRAAGVHVVGAEYDAGGVLLTVAGRDVGRLTSLAAELTGGRARAREAGSIATERPFRAG